jgi:hypothetical protein
MRLVSGSLFGRGSARISILALFAWAPAMAQPSASNGVGAVVGTVRDSAGAPVPGVEVSVVGTRALTRSDTAGRFRLAGLTPGKTSVRFRRMGFAPKTIPTDVAAGETAELAVALAPLAQELPGVVVEEDERRAREMLQEFYHRQSQGFGQFITRKEIEKRDPSNLSDMMRLVPGARLLPVRGAGGRSLLRFSRAMMAPGRDCPPQYWVDGVMAYGMNIDDLNPRDIEGIEIYQGASVVPAEYNNHLGTTICGVVLIWSRVPGT